MKDKDIKILAQKIVKAEQELQEGKNIQENQKKIEDILLSISISDAMIIDAYITKNNLLTK